MIGWLFQHAKHEQHNSQVSKIIRKHFEQIDELTDSRGCTLLHILAQHDNLSLLSFVLNLYDQKPLPFTKAEWLNLNDNEGNTPLHYSAFKGSLSAVQLLQKSGANSWAINKKGLNCVHFAAQAGSPLIMYYFMEKGISIDCVDHNRNTPLHWAVYAGSDCAVTALLCWGAAADLQEQNGDTALHIAVMFGRMKTIAKLVSYGCDVTIKNKNDRTAYELALEQGYENIQSYLLPQERTCFKRLLCRESAGGIHKRSMFGLSISVLLLSLILNSVSFYIYSNTAIFALFITTIVLGAACFILLIILHNTDAGSISSRRYDKDAYMKLLIQNDPKVICFQCQIKKPVRSKHCYECGRCIRVFDHHCSWLGNCIGTNNTLLFIILLLICTIYIILTLLSHIIGIATSSEYDFGTLKAGLFVCSSLSVILSILGLVPISYLLVRHCRLSLRGVTFYEHYKLSIAKRSNGDIMLKEKRKIVTGREEIMRKEKAPSEDSSSTHRRPLINRQNIDHDQQRRSSDLLQSKGCFQQAKWLLCKNKYVKQYGWNEQP